MSVQEEVSVGPVFDSLAIRYRTLPNLLRRAVEGGGERIFLDIEGGPLAFAELADIAAGVGGGLAALGVGPGDRVATVVGNRAEYVSTLFGVAWIGAIAAPLAANLRGPLVAARLEHSGASVVVVEHGALAVIRDALAVGVPGLRVVVVVDGAVEPIDGVEVMGWDAIASAPPAPAADVAFDDPLMIMYTSGTTGPAKGVVVSHHQAYCASVPLVDGFGWTSEDILWSCLPLNHAAAMHHVLLPALAVGARAVLRPTFSASGFWEDVTASGATYVQIIGTMANILMGQPPSPLDTAHAVRALTSFPAPIDPEGFTARFGVALNTQAYGMTEVYPNQPTLAQAVKGPTCLGRPSPLFELAVVDDDDVALPRGSGVPGEIVVRPRLPSSMLTGYFRDPAATADAFRNLWFHTGDLGTIDDEGYLFYVGRKKDMIRRRGENISAFEVEREVLRFPGVAQAAAFGVPSELGEEDVKIDVVSHAGADVDPHALADFLADRLAPFMRPRYVQIRSELPLTPSGRVEKYRLRAEPLTAAVEVRPPSMSPSAPQRR